MRIALSADGDCTINVVLSADFIIELPNVPSDLSLLAFGMVPAREAEIAGTMTKVPKGQGLGRLAR